MIFGILGNVGCWRITGVLRVGAVLRVFRVMPALLRHCPVWLFGNGERGADHILYCSQRILKRLDWRTQLSYILYNEIIIDRIMERLCGLFLFLKREML